MQRFKSMLSVALVMIVLILSLWFLSRLIGNTKATTAAGEQEQPRLVVAETKFTIPPDLLKYPSEMKACAANLKKIYESIVRYKQAKDILPNWLFDLVPDYIPAPSLLCPITRNPTSVFYPDPSLPCSYSYEFCLTPILPGWDPLRRVSTRTWKMQELVEFGDVVPIVRCHCHRGHVLNLSVTGQIYLTGTDWEYTFNAAYRYIPASPDLAGNQSTGRLRIEPQIMDYNIQPKNLYSPAVRIQLPSNRIALWDNRPSKKIKDSPYKDFHWSKILGPGKIEFDPSDSTLDAQAVFDEPGVYSIRCSATGNNLPKFDHTITIVVYPKDYDGLVALYSFDDGTAADSSNNKLHGVFKGDSGVVKDPQRGKVLKLDGIGDYVDCGKDPRFEITNAITIASWVKVNAFDKQWQAIVTKGDSSWRIARFLLSNQVRFNCSGTFSQDTTGFRSGVQSVRGIADGRWHHVAGVYDGHRLCLYVDGILDTSTPTQESMWSNGCPVWIGENSDELGRGWNGWIDDVRIYDRALTAEQIKDLMNPATAKWPY